MRSFTWNQLPIKICDWFLAYFNCGVKLLECRYAQVLNHRKKIKAEPYRLISLKQRFSIGGARSRRIDRGAIAPPFPKVAPNISRVIKLCKPNKYFSANRRKCLRNLLHHFVEPDQSNVVHQLSMVNQRLCAKGGNSKIFHVKPRIFVKWAKIVKFHYSVRNYVNNLFC